MDNETKQILNLILDKLVSVETRIGGLETRIGIIETKQDEMFEVVKAIEHSNNTRKAEIDNLNYKVANVEGTINGVGEFIQKGKVQ